MKPVVYEADDIVVGTGPGGATAGLELAKKGRKVLFLEKGKLYQKKGGHLSALFYTDRRGFFYTEEGLNVIRGIGVGGSTILYCGCSADPPVWLKDKYNIDLSGEAEETKKELAIKPLDDEFLGEGSTRILESALKLGFKWEKIPKFISPSRSKKFSCSSTCMTGCFCGAKWTSQEWVEEAIKKGAKLITSAEVDSLILQNGKCRGVRGFTKGKSFEARAERVILSAGGIGTSLILQKTRIPAGYGFSIDPTIIVYGRLKKGKGNFYDPPMTVGSYEFEREGFMLASLTDTWLTYPMQMFMKKKTKLFDSFFQRRVLGIMVKTKDELAGSITIEGSISKPLTDEDRKRMNKGASVAREILINAGCDPGSIMISPVRGTHPQGTARLGDVVDENGKVKDVDFLYVVDASIIPESLDRPMVLTIIAFSKRVIRGILEH